MDRPVQRPQRIRVRPRGRRQPRRARHDTGAADGVDMLFEAGENVTCEVNDDFEFFCSTAIIIGSPPPTWAWMVSRPRAITDENAMDGVGGGH